MYGPRQVMPSVSFRALFLTFIFQLLEKGRVIGMAEGMAVEDFIRQVNLQLLRMTRRYPTDLSIADVVTLLTYVAYITSLPPRPVVRVRSAVNVHEAAAAPAVSKVKKELQNNSHRG